MSDYNKSKSINIIKKEKPKEKTIDLNFSVYLDSQVQNTPPNEDFLQNHIYKIYPKNTSEWVDSNKVNKCQSCPTKFSLFVRKHHCRACGGVFCYYCCNKYTKIPNNLFDIPKETEMLTIYLKNTITKIAGKQDDSVSLVCNDCNNKISNLNNIQHLIHICEFLSLRDLYNVMLINKQWYNASIHCLSKFRNIQYKAPDHIYSKWECNMICTIKENLLGHNSWFNILIKTSLINNIIYQKNNLDELNTIIKEYSDDKKIQCWNLMCSRKCNMSFNQIDFIDIMQYLSLIPNFHTKLWNDNDNKLINILYELSNKINKESYDKNNFLIITYLISSFKQLIEKTPDYSLTNVKSNEFFHKILTNFTAFTTNMCNINMRDANMLILLSFEYNYFKNKSIVNNSDDQITQVINMFLKATLSPELKCLISKTINTLSKLSIDKKNMIGTTDKNILPIIYPLDTKFLITDIVKVQELQSSSCPLLVTVLIQDDKLKLNKIEKKFILKTDSGLRKENIVSSLIIILQNKLIQQMKRGRIDYFEPIPTYKIIMITNNIGVIEFLDDCLTLKNINSKNYTLQNYILDNNKDSRIKTIKERFAKSLAISSCLSYVLGLGDRHASNIMISKSGHIIHIDYGYILENPIHSTIVNNPIIRISHEMIDFLGGWNSEYYDLFKNYIIKVFDIIRLYSDIIINYYNILANENIIDWSIFKKRLTDRFLNGMTFKDIEVVLLDVIESSSNGYGGVFIDLCNDYGSKLKLWK
jgi:hypothetical protein